MDNENKQLLNEVAAYYSEKLATHGNNPKGVDWNTQEGQLLRFEKLSGIIQSESSFSINDLGCGYGAFLDYLTMNYHDFAYTGVDISKNMISSAIEKFSNVASARFIHASQPDQAADYTIASGIFNVRLNRTDSEWEKHLYETLDVLHETSRLGFGVNFLTSYSDKPKMKDYLYYADPCSLFDFCMKRYSRHISIIHDYGLYEFTIHVRKTSFQI